MKTIRMIFMLLLIMLPLSKTFAFNYGFLRDSAISNFTDKDSDLMMTNAYHALNKVPDNQKSSWNNAASGAWGYAVPSHTVQKNGTTCRQLFMYNNAHHIPGESSYQFCKLQGEWKIVS